MEVWTPIPTGCPHGRRSPGASSPTSGHCCSSQGLYWVIMGYVGVILGL